ncbi:MAG: multiheme c-type cytochrome [Armatimonadota bacterium]
MRACLDILVISKLRLVSVIVLTLCLAIVVANYASSTKKVRIIYTNDLMGWLESCGCPGKRLGGLAQRATVISRLIRENPNVVIVDSGNQSDKPERLDFIMSVLAGLGYDAVGIGEFDRRFEREFLDAASKHNITVVDAGAWEPAKSAFSRPVTTRQVVPYVLKNVARVMVGIISFGVSPELEPNEEQSRIKAMQLALKEVRKSCNILVALDQAGLITREWVERNASETGVPDIVIGGVSRAQSPPIEIIGKCYLVQTSVNGSHVGVVDVEVTPTQPSSFIFDRIALDLTVKEDFKIKQRVSKFLDSIGQRAVVSKTTGGAATSDGYLHPNMCRACHSYEYRDWTTTKHARALRTLDQSNRLIPECLQCHSEAYRRTRVVNVPPDGIAGIECITCHRLPNPHWNEQRAPSGTWKVDPKLCKECHTPERSAAYEEKTYLPRVSHGIISSPKSTNPSGS